MAGVDRTQRQHCQHGFARPGLREPGRPRTMRGTWATSRGTRFVKRCAHPHVGRPRPYPLRGVRI